jgi:hypothetical protein
MLASADVSLRLPLHLAVQTPKGEGTSKLSSIYSLGGRL